MPLRFVFLVVLTHLLVALGLAFSVLFVVLGWTGPGREWTPADLFIQWGKELHFVFRQLLDPARRPYAIAIVADIVLLPVLIGLWQSRQCLLGRRPGLVLTPFLIIGLGLAGFLATHFALDLILLHHGRISMIDASLMKMGMSMVAAWIVVYAVISPLASLLAARIRVPPL
jgi:hypothetical protein